MGTRRKLVTLIPVSPELVKSALPISTAPILVVNTLQIVKYHAMNKKSHVFTWGEIVWLNQSRETDMIAEMLSSTPTPVAKLLLLPVETVIVIHLVRRKFLNVDGWSWIAQKPCVKSKPIVKWINVIKYIHQYHQ